MAKEGIKLFGKDGLIFDHTNPLDYLTFVPGLGVLGIGAKVLGKLGKANKFKNFPRTQYHGGHSSVERKMADKVGMYTTPDPNYARIFVSRGERAVKEYGPTGLYKLDLGAAKNINIELVDKPSKKLKKAIEAQLNKKRSADEIIEGRAQQELNSGLRFLFSGSPFKGVEGGAPVIAGRETIDWLRKQGVDVLTGSPTLKKGLKAKGTEAEYFLLKDIPKKKLSEAEIKEVLKASRGFSKGGEVSNNLQDFLAVATEAITVGQSAAPIEMPQGYRHGGRVRLI